jgi:hypothetical protein
VALTEDESDGGDSTQSRRWWRCSSHRGWTDGSWTDGRVAKCFEAVRAHVRKENGDRRSTVARLKHRGKRKREQGPARCRAMEEGVGPAGLHEGLEVSAW